MYILYKRLTAQTRTAFFPHGTPCGRPRFFAICATGNAEPHREESVVTVNRSAPHRDVSKTEKPHRTMSRRTAPHRKVSKFRKSHRTGPHRDVFTAKNGTVNIRSSGGAW